MPDKGNLSCSRKPESNILNTYVSSLLKDDESALLKHDSRHFPVAVDHFRIYVKMSYTTRAQMGIAKSVLRRFI